MPKPPEDNSLKEQMQNILSEARMVLPGIQALFGFQTIAVFNQRFTELTPASKYCYLCALALVVVSIALVMAPAAWHRIVEPHRVSARTVRLSSRLICLALLPLTAAIALDIYLVVELTMGMPTLSICVSALVLVLLAACWFAMPFWNRAK